MKKILGTVYKSTGSWYSVKTDEEWAKARLRGKTRLDSDYYTNPVSVGDQVWLQKHPDGFFTIEDVEDRDNVFMRKAAGKKDQAQILASNLDNAILVQALHKPNFKIGFIDRFLLTCEAYSVTPIIVLNKMDLVKKNDFELKEFKSVYEPLGYTIIYASVSKNEGLEEVKAITKDKRSVFVGQSGVGKSSLLNSIEPRLNASVGDISEFNEKGKHTTTYAEMFDLSYGGQLIDTPGIREFGIVGFEDNEIAWYFKEMAPFKEQCRFKTCTCEKEPNCPISDAVDAGQVNPIRMNSYYNIIESLREQ